MTKYDVLNKMGLRPGWYRLVAFIPLLILFFLLFSPLVSSAQEPIAPPAATPDAEAGLRIYGERCATCHGPLGQGDGEMAAQLPQPPTALADPSYLREATPAQMFDTITHGIITSGMPPFGPGSSNPISEANRWNLVAAIYSLGTPQETIDAGQLLYEQNCLECHGAEGGGTSSDLSDPGLWLNRSDQTVHDALATPSIDQHQSFELNDDELWTVVSYARSLSYDYIALETVAEPIDAAVIHGTATNETTGETLPAGTIVELSGFTSNFEPTVTISATVDEAGSYEIELTQVPPDLTYIVTLAYKGVNFASNAGRLQRDDPTLTLPVAVYEPTTDASDVRIAQLHVILEFREGAVQVSELYQFSQNAPAVFIGESGDMDKGTVHIALPQGAASPTFSRSFSGIESFFPATDVIETENGWADTVPLRPGSGTLNLLVAYSLPYERGLSFEHTIRYSLDNVNLLIPDAGVRLADAQQWQVRGTQNIGNSGTYSSYSQGNLRRTDTVSFQLEGRPNRVATAEGMVPLRDEAKELLIGGGVLLLALVLSGLMIWQWQQNKIDAPAQAETDSPAPAAEQRVEERREELLHAIAALDDAYEAGEVETNAYRQQRAALKGELVAIWQSQE